LTRLSRKHKVTTAIPTTFFARFFLFNAAVVIIGEIPTLNILEGEDNTSLLLYLIQIIGIVRIVTTSAIRRGMKDGAHISGTWRFRLILTANHKL